MAIVTIREGYSGHQAGGEADNKTATRHFSLVTDNVADDARFDWPQNDPTDTTIIIPAPGTYYPGHTDIRSKEPQVKKVSPTFFNVEVRYGEDIDQTGKRGEDKWAANPLNKPAEITWEALFNREEVTEDINGVSYVNIFNELVPGAEREFADVVLHMRRNEAIFDVDNLYNWTHTVYDGVFRNMPKGRVLMNDIKVEDVHDEDEASETFGELLYCKVVYDIIFRFRPTPLINAYELKLSSTEANTAVFSTLIADTEENQSHYAWFDRRAHTATGQLDENNEFVPFPDGKEHPININTKRRIYANDTYSLPIPHFVFQQRHLFATWPGVA